MFNNIKKFTTKCKFNNQKLINNKIQNFCNFTKISKFNNNICHEYNILNKLKHPNIVSVIRKEKDNTQLILEKGNYDLYDYILIQNINMAENEIIIIIRNIAEALHYMHENDYVHNDIKLENILLFKNSEGELLAKLIDLEFAYNIKNSKYQNNNTHYGTKLYYSPEMSNNVKYCQKSADMWAFGIVIHIMLFGNIQKKNYLLNNNSNNSNNYNSKNNYDIICVIINNLLQNDPSKRWSANKIINYIIKYKY